MNKVLWIDIESTGRDKKLNDIIQIAGLIEIDGEIKAEFNYLCQPFSYNNIEPEALEIQGRTIEDIKSFPDQREIFNKFQLILSKYVNKFDKIDKFYPAGYRVDFDLDFLYEWFVKNGDKYFGSWQNWHKIDPLQYLFLLEYQGKIKLENYKLETVCKHFGIEIKAHDALSDIRATRKVFQEVIRLLFFPSPCL